MGKEFHSCFMCGDAVDTETAPYSTLGGFYCEKHMDKVRPLRFKFVTETGKNTHMKIEHYCSDGELVEIIKDAPTPEYCEWLENKIVG